MKAKTVWVSATTMAVLVAGGIGTAFASGVDPFDPSTYETNFGPGEPYYSQNVAIRTAWQQATMEEKLNAIFHPTVKHAYDPFGLDTAKKVKLTNSYQNLSQGKSILNPGYLQPKGYPDVLDSAPFKAHYKPTVTSATYGN